MVCVREIKTCIKNLTWYSKKIYNDRLKAREEMAPISLFIVFLWISKLILIKANSEVFNQCLRSPKPNVIRCIGQQTLTSLHYLDKMDNFTIVTGLDMIRPDDDRQRSLTEFFVEDPTDFR